MKSKENFYKGRRFRLSMNIADKPHEFPGEVVESYGALCMVQEQKAYIQGRYNDYGIYVIVKDKDGQDQLSAMLIDYSASDVPKYSAPESQVRAKFATLVAKMQLEESENELRSDRKIKAELAKEATTKLKADNIAFIKNQINEIDQQLREMMKGRTSGEIYSDKKVRESIMNEIVLDKIFECLTKKRM